MSKIRIVNWLLTRRCNLNCDYCAIVKNYKYKPDCYPDMQYYKNNEMSTRVILNALKRMKKHNPEMFHIFYGGEPTLRKDLPDIINYCNKNKIFYTIISNNTPEVQPMINTLFKEVDYIQGFTSSIDSVSLNNKNRLSNDKIKKSLNGFQRLKEFQQSGKVKDVVAEITITNNNINSLQNIVEKLSQANIYSSITFVDIAKTPYYDFSNVTALYELVKPTLKVAQIITTLYKNNNFLIHMKELLKQTLNILPSNYDCHLENGIHNITVDADGGMRLCLRIKGEITPRIHVSKLFRSNSSSLSQKFYNAICIDKKNLCKLCNHTCLMMSQIVDNNSNKNGELIHSDIRGE